MINPIKVKIISGVSSFVSSDRAMVDDYCVYLKLCALYEGGVILGIKNRYLEISEVLGLKKSKFYSVLKRLKNRGWVWSEGNNLFVKSQKKIAKEFGLKSKTKKRFDYKHDTKKIVKALCIEENINKQKYFIKRNVINSFIKIKYGTIYSSNTLKKIYSRVLSNFRKDPSVLLRVLKSNGVLNDSSSFSVMLSRKKIAELFGCKSASSGSKIIDELRCMGIVTDERKFKLLKRGIELSEYKKIKNFYLANNIYCFWSGGNIYSPICNEINVLTKDFNKLGSSSLPIKEIVGNEYR